MSKKIAPIINSLVNVTQSLGVGLVDSGGLLIYSSGHHANKDKDEFIVYLWAMSPKKLDSFLDDRVREYIILSDKHKIYCYWLDNAKYLLYVLAKEDAQGKIVRSNLHATAKKIEQVCNFDSIISVSQRLEQPRHMSSDRWPAEDFENILK